jgi:hypothetical protein
MLNQNPEQIARDQIDKILIAQKQPEIYVCTIIPASLRLIKKMKP